MRLNESTVLEWIVVMCGMAYVAALMSEIGYHGALRSPPLELARMRNATFSRWTSRDWDLETYPDLANLTYFMANEARSTRHHCLTAARVGIPLRVIVFAAPSPHEPLVNPIVIHHGNSTTRLGRYKREEDEEIEIVPIHASVTVSYLGRYLARRVATFESKDAECVQIALLKFI